jgi:hypothetical protein
VPSLDLRFAENKSLVDSVSGQNLITFTRASTKMVTNSQGVLESVGIDVPAFDHNPLTGECLGLLVEEQRQNLLLRSEEFDDASWSKSVGVTIAANNELAPNGTLTADLVQFDAADKSFSQTVSTTNGTSHALSVWVKGTAGESIRLSGANLTGASNYTLTGQWQRLSFVGTSSSTSISLGVSTFGGATARNVYLWGAQLEAGAFPTSYIPTTGTAATRTADVVSISGTNFSSWYRQDEGCVFVDAFNSAAPIGGAARRLFELNNNSEAERFFSGFNTTTTLQTLVQDNSVIQANLTQAVPGPVSASKIAASYKLDDLGIVANGGAVGLDTQCTLPTPTQLTIGYSTSGGNSTLNAPIRRLTYWPVRLGNNVLQQITQ